MSEGYMGLGPDHVDAGGPYIEIGRCSPADYGNSAGSHEEVLLASQVPQYQSDNGQA
jgi:hypothetical protein